MKKMLMELHKWGLTDKAIGEVVGRDQSIINRLRNGETKKCDYDTGQAIKVLWQKRKRKIRRTV